ncbi:MAG: FAD-dependent oxidoreductase, partial [Kofleriaceae bacterium]
PPRARAASPASRGVQAGGPATNLRPTTPRGGPPHDSKVLQDAQRGVGQLAPVFPGLAWNGRATQALPHKSPLFNASYSFYRVGQYTDFAGYEGAPQGGVHFCGEHTSLDFQGYMEGGAITGKQTAKDLIRRF